MLRAPLSVIAVVAVLTVLSGCGGSGGDQAYSNAVARQVDRLSSSATAMSGALLAASSPGDVKAVRQAATSQLRLVSEVLQSVTTLDTPPDFAKTTATLREAVLANRKYLATVKAAAAPDPSAGLRAMPRAKRDGAAMLGDYRRFFTVSPEGLADGISDVGLTDLSGLARAQRAARAPAAPAANSAPVLPPPEEEGDGVVTLSDVVANSGGEGVRYRFSPSLSDVVPGNGPFEGDQVSVTCYTQGETVKGNPWWARLANGYYVPATFLQYGSAGPPAGVTYC